MRPVDSDQPPTCRAGHKLSSFLFHLQELWHQAFLTKRFQEKGQRSGRPECQRVKLYIRHVEVFWFPGVRAAEGEKVADGQETDVTF